MFCIVAFIVLSILGIFSASNRRLAREALDCVLRRVTFRPCNTGFDEKVKAKILGKAIMRSEKLAIFINKRFEILAWIFFMLFLSASVMGARGLYLFYTTGSCNGVNSEAFCVFDPTGANNEVSAVGNCPVDPPTIDDLTLAGLDVDSFPILNADAPGRSIVFIGCYSCDYSRKTYPLITKLANRYNAKLTYLEYPVKLHSDYLNKVGYCAYQQDPQKYWEMNEVLFSTEKVNLEDDQEFIQNTLVNLGIDTAALNSCVNNPETVTFIETQMEQIRETKFYGTPTIFIGEDVFVGPKPYRVYAISLKGFFYWLRK